MDKTFNYANTKYKISVDGDLASILLNEGISLFISTYQAGRVIALSGTSDNRIRQTPFSFKRPMGIAVRDDILAIATKDEIQVFERSKRMARNIPNATHDHDEVMLLRAKYFSGETDLHDIFFGKGGLWAVNTAFSCLSIYDVTHSFRPKWAPPFVSDIGPGDRCHLNGMAAEDGVPRFVTALGKTDAPKGWKEGIADGGVLMSVPDGEIILDKLGMPHSPRLINGELYLLLSATGQIIKVDPTSKSYSVLAETKRFIRGMSAWNNYLFVAMSKGRSSSETFRKIPVAEASTHAGVLVFDMRSGEKLGELRYEATVDEIFDLQVLPIQNPALITQEDERHNTAVTTPNFGLWKKGDSK